MPSESIDIKENQNGQRRVIRHTFYGRDEKEVKRNERAHRKSDKFFDAAIKGKEFKGVPVKAIKKRRSRKMAKSKRTKRKDVRGYIYVKILQQGIRNLEVVRELCKAIRDGMPRTEKMRVHFSEVVKFCNRQIAGTHKLLNGGRGLGGCRCESGDFCPLHDERRIVIPKQ